MSYKPSDAYRKTFAITSPTTGALANADTLPVVTANRNGTDDGTFTLTVTNLSTGRYLASGTIPSGYVSGDVINFWAAAAVGGLAGGQTIDTVILDGKRVADLHDLAGTAQTGDAFARIGAAGAGLTALGDVRVANLDAAVSTRSTYAGGSVASVTGNVGGNVTGSVASVTGNVGGNVTGSVASVTGNVGGNVTGSVASVVAGVTVTTNNDKAGYALSATGLDVAKGWGTWSARQTLQAIAQFLQGKRTGVPLSGVSGTATYQDNASVSYGSVTVDTTGDITTSGMTPPA